MRGPVTDSLEDEIGRIVSDKELKTLERAVLSAVRDTKRNLDRYRMLVFWDADPRRVSHSATYDPPIVQLILRMRDQYDALVHKPGISDAGREEMQMALLSKMTATLERFGKMTLETAKVAQSVLMSIASLSQRQREHKANMALKWAELDQKGITPLSEAELMTIAHSQPLNDETPIVIADDPPAEAP